ncbi:mitogen-activated protein kinase kinase kinase 3 [Selaginella moellendorffii]|uniref:mitogen-activated protein kinase kinase kinase 3 n=1 Tax=Selaginella moellendorffii TaxID=88036 RepID=UPI000D1C76CF|nr:mitogen-activated protein kinase kinase kinase 3 [Selaginella moellendorffii]|eukprot:XP_002971342.2 mitogen-activated protein kinase kinase kinase 3 [Selaginella moellendorffii]
MPSWWGKSSSKDGGGKKENILSSLLYPPKRRKNKQQQAKEEEICVKSVGAAEAAPLARTSPSAAVGRSASFGGLPSQAQPLPLPPGEKHSRKSGNAVIQRYPSFPLPPRKDGIDMEVGYTESGSASSTSSLGSSDVVDTAHGTVAARVGNLRVLTKPDQSLTFSQAQTRHGVSCPTSPHLRNNFLVNVPGEALTYGRNHGILNGTRDSYLVSPVRSTILTTAEMLSATPRSLQSTPDPASGHGSSPGSGHNSTVDTGQTSWCQSRASPELSPNPSPRRSPGPSSRVQSQAVSPLHKRAGGSDQERYHLEVSAHRLPLPPAVPSPLVASNFPPSPNASAVPPRSPNRSDSPTTSTTKWQKGKLIGRGSFGNVYVGFDSENVGRMCAMKEVPLLSDDSKSKESVKQLSQEIATLSRLRHTNIVQYYGSETMEDGLYIYLEYVSGGSIHKLLQEYGAFKEPVIRSYTRQILSGLAYLHSTSTVHRDIKGANILVDTNGIVKLADFGMAKHLSVESFPLSFKGSPYWMAPEVIKQTHGYDLSVDVWSLGCTVLEMATAKPPWSQYEGIAAMFKIGNSKEIPSIPEYLTRECKNFLRLCLQRNPAERPTATFLLGHPFVCNAPPVCTPDDRCDIAAKASTFVGSLAIGSRIHEYDSVLHPKTILHSPTSEQLSPRAQGFASSSVSPCASPKIRALSPHHLHLGISSSQSSSPVISSGSSTPITGGYGNVPRSANGSFGVPTLHNEHHNFQKLGLTGGSPVRKNGMWSIPPSPPFEGSPRQGSPRQGSPRQSTDILGMALGRVPREDDDYHEHFSQQLLRSQQMFPRTYFHHGHPEKREPSH